MPTSPICEVVDEGLKHRSRLLAVLGFDVGFGLPIHRFCDDFVRCAGAVFPLVVNGILEFLDCHFVISLFVVGGDSVGVGEVIYFTLPKRLYLHGRFFYHQIEVVFLFLFGFNVVLVFVFAFFVLVGVVRFILVFILVLKVSEFFGGERRI